VALAGCGGGGSEGSATAAIGVVGSLPAGVVARVDDRPITAAQLERTLQQGFAQEVIQNRTVPAEGTPAYDDARRNALQNLVGAQIYAIEAARCGRPCLVTDADVRAKEDETVRAEFGGSRAQYERLLAASKLTLADARALIRTRLRQDRIRANVTRSVRFTRAQALAYYRANRRRYMNPELRTARHILVATRAEAEALRGRLSDANFAAMARAHSIDTSSKDDGGNLGTVLPGALPDLDAAIAALALREISQPIETRFGWHIIQVTGITPPRTFTFAEVGPTILEDQLELRRRAALARWQDDVFEGWRKRTVYADASLRPAPAAPTPTALTVTGATAPAGP
jgi:peptidyl-prolyl cis-trans isomerase C